MKKICFFFNSMNASGGVERVISNLVNNLCEKYDITIFVKDEGESFYKIDERIKIKTLSNFLSFNMDSRIDRIIAVFRNTLTTVRKIKANNILDEFDYVYTATPLDSLQVYLSLKNKEKLVVSEHASRDAYNHIYKIMRRLVYKKANYVIVPTTLDTERYKMDGYKSIFIPHLTSFKPHSVRNKEKIVLNVGRLTEDKQQLLLLNIWNQLKVDNKIENWKLMIVGSGELETVLENKIKDLDLVDTVILKRATPNIEELYEKSSIFAFTSRMEGYGMVLTEAMSYGMPCISFDCPSGPRDIIDDDVNGFLIPCFEQTQYAIKLSRLMNDSELRESFSFESLKKIEMWDNKGIIDKWNKIFK